MDAFPDRHAYRCLPLSIANGFGWEALCPVPIEIEWNGGPKSDDLTVRALKPLDGGRSISHFAKSNFSRGIVTFHLDYIFRTDPGWDLLATGPFNDPKDNAIPLTGVMESDWLPYPFTMNWQIMRPGLVRFEEGEPFCSIFPVQKSVLVDCQPEIFSISDNEELVRQHEAFRTERESFMAKLNARDPATIKQAWQKHYFVGRHPDGERVDQHVNKLRLKEVIDRRGNPNASPSEGTKVMTDVVNGEAKGARVGLGPILSKMASAAEEANEAGRRRIDGEGRLTPTSRTRVIRSQADASDCDFLVVDGLLSPEQCEIVCDAFGEMGDALFKSDKIDPYWNNRMLWFKDVKRRRPDAAEIMASGQHRGMSLLRDFYHVAQPIYADILQIVQWKSGMFMPAHADNANPDGSPHHMAYRDLASIVYLNDNYDGGELYFTALDIVIKPKRGMFVAMSAGFHHEHAVLRVNSGLRLTMPSFLTLDATRADKTLIRPA